MGQGKGLWVGEKAYLGAKARFSLWAMRPKAEALGYLEAKATGGSPFDFAQGQNDSQKGKGNGEDNGKRNSKRKGKRKGKRNGKGQYGGSSHRPAGSGSG